MKDKSFKNGFFLIWFLYRVLAYNVNTFHYVQLCTQIMKLLMILCIRFHIYFQVFMFSRIINISTYWSLRYVRDSDFQLTYKVIIWLKINYANIIFLEIPKRYFWIWIFFKVIFVFDNFCLLFYFFVKYKTYKKKYREFINKWVFHLWNIISLLIKTKLFCLHRSIFRYFATYSICSPWASSGHEINNIM